ncbi:AlpA family transcriptional regulator, partial [Actinotalea sp. K2]|uniref:helix-turn-helix transcriptional regulator n=1 Tax=Actinotalea sp. K2 TaxID=2939438 RepID=UPI002017720D
RASPLRGPQPSAATRIGAAENLGRFTSLPERTYSPEEVAERLGTSRWWIRQQVRDGRLEHLRLGKARIRFTEAQVAAIVANATVAPSPTPPREPIDTAVLGPTVRSLGAHRTRPSARRDGTEVL